MPTEEANEFDADYEVSKLNPEFPTSFTITRKPRDGVGAETTLRHYSGRISILAEHFTFNEGTKLDSGWCFGNREFFERDDLHQEDITWYCDGRSLAFREGKPLLDRWLSQIVHTSPRTKHSSELRGQAKLINGQSASVLGYPSYKNTNGTCNIRLAEANAPPHFNVSNDDGSFNVELQLDPTEFDRVLKGISRTGHLYIELSDFVSTPILVEEAGFSSTGEIFWVPCIPPFHDLYARLKETLQDGYRKSPRAGLFSGEQTIVQAEQAGRNPPDEGPWAQTKDHPRQDATVLLEPLKQELSQLRKSVGNLVRVTTWCLVLLVVVAATLALK